MPSFDIVSKVEMPNIDNAVAGVMREVGQRYDFKGSNTEVKREEEGLVILADDTYKLQQVQEMLKMHLTRHKIDAKALSFGKEEMASGNTIRQNVAIQNGIPTEKAKEVVKEIKAAKMKVQASIRGDEVRVEGKKRDDLQQVMALAKGLPLDLPLQFINFRD